jgi:hypothetical protein
LDFASIISGVDSEKLFCLFFSVVSVTDRSTEKINAPFVDLNWPDTFFVIFIFLIALSDELLSGGALG